MNYYQHHIGDFIRDTARLSDSQSMAYLRLIWLYYETEQPLENDVDAIAFKIGANASEVHQILKHFFFLHDDGMWHQARCDKEILAYRVKSEKAKKGASARWENANAMRTQCERNANATLSDANQEPITNNQEPRTNNQEKDKTLPAVASAKPVSIRKAQEMAFLKNIPDLDTQIAADWLQVRHAKKSPLTTTALAMVTSQAAKAGLTTAQAIAFAAGKGWAGFSAKWYENEIGPGDSQKTNAERTQDYKNQQAEKFYAPLLTMTDEEKREWGFA